VKSITALTHDVAGDIVVYGSGQLVHTLLEHDLADELRLTICPFVLGDGQRLFDQASDHTSLRLTGTRTIGDSIVQLVYRPTGNA
jgi:dihydrofolate reductase